MKLSTCVLIFTISLLATPALASSDAAWAELNKASAKACIAASGFLKANVSSPMRFSDTVGYDARIVSGIYPQKHMNGAKGRMLCLYSRKAKNVEVQEFGKQTEPK